MNKANRSLFAIEPNYLTIGEQYRFSVKMIMNKTNITLFEEEFLVNVYPAPKTGRLFVDPYKGDPFDTEFRIYAPDWVVRHRPARYQFAIEDAQGNLNVINELFTQSYVIMKLPSTSKVVVKVIDDKGITVTANATIFCPFKEDIEPMKRVYESVRNDPNKIKQTIYYAMIASDLVKLQDKDTEFASKLLNHIHLLQGMIRDYNPT